MQQALVSPGIFPGEYSSTCPTGRASDTIYGPFIFLLVCLALTAPQLLDWHRRPVGEVVWPVHRPPLDYQRPCIGRAVRWIDGPLLCWNARGRAISGLPGHGFYGLHWAWLHDWLAGLGAEQRPWVPALAWLSWRSLAEKTHDRSMRPAQG